MELFRNLRRVALFSFDADPTMIYSDVWTSASTADDLRCVCERDGESVTK